MPLSQQKFREIVFQLLYSQDVANPDEAFMLELMSTELAVSKKNIRLAQERIKKIKEYLPQIDSLIASISTGYAFNRIQIVTKNILRIGVFEILFDDQIPSKVAIAEAIRLSRKFNTPESASFVNALLDCLFQNQQGKKANSQELLQQSQALIQSEQLRPTLNQEQSSQQRGSSLRDMDEKD